MLKECFIIIIIIIVIVIIIIIIIIIIILMYIMNEAAVYLIITVLLAEYYNCLIYLPLLCKGICSWCDGSSDRSFIELFLVPASAPRLV